MAIEPEKIASVLTTRDFAADLEALTALIGAPTFVDGMRWAQFDLGGARVCLAAQEEQIGPAAVLAKVSDLEGALESARNAGLSVEAPKEGAHEVRAIARTPGGVEIVFYRPLL